MDRTAYIIRQRRSDHGTEGILISGSFSRYTLELPWRNNHTNISCIPSGTYPAQIRVSPKYGIIYWVQDVDGRTYILIHAGNWAGDVAKELRTHTYGCILLGTRRGWLNGQRAVLASRIAVRRFMHYFEKQPFILTIGEAF